jgi:hypothetical protein
MTDQQHPITPPPFELISQWHKKACKDPYNGGRFIESKVLRYITTAAAQWGSDQELEACCEWVRTNCFGRLADELRAARRPKPPSLKEQALDALQLLRIHPELIEIINVKTELKEKYDTIRSALEQLND